MQRVSVRQPQRQQQATRSAQMRNQEQSPALAMARRVNAEQGKEQLKAYLLAMEPFVAPNELRSISNSFGLDFDSIERPKKQSPALAKSGVKQGNGMNMGGLNMGSMGGNNQMQMLQMMMNMQRMMNGKGDMSQIMKFMGGKNGNK